MKRDIKVAVSFDDCVIPYHYQIARELFKFRNTGHVLYYNS